MNNKTEVARVSFEFQDDALVAFLTQSGPGERRIPIGSINIVFSEEEALVERFAALMNECVQHFFQQATGQIPDVVREELT